MVLGLFVAKRGVHIGVKPLYTWGVLAKKVTFFDIFGAKSRTFGGLGSHFLRQKVAILGVHYGLMYRYNGGRFGRSLWIN